MPKIDRLGKISGLLLTVAVLSTIPSSAASATTVKLDLNGVAPVVHQVDSSGSVTVPEVKVEFDGMSFKGWNTSPTGDGKSYNTGDTISSDTTLYAQWADGTHIGGGTVDPDPGGGEEPGGGEDPDPDPGGDEGEDPNPTPDPNPDDGNQDEDDKPNQDTNPDSDSGNDNDNNSDSDNDSNPNPGTITGDVSGGSNNGGSNNNNSNGTGDTGRQDTALNPGSPTAGFINLTTLSNIKTAAPLAAIASGTLAVLAVLLLTNKEAKRVKQASSRRHNNKATKVKLVPSTSLTPTPMRLQTQTVKTGASMLMMRECRMKASLLSCPRKATQTTLAPLLLGGKVVRSSMGRLNATMLGPTSTRTTTVSWFVTSKLIILPKPV